MTMKSKLLLFLLLSLAALSQGQAQKLDSLLKVVRAQYLIPGLGVAVVSSDSILEMEVQGVPHLLRTWQLNKQSVFRLGSNTKAITSFVAAQLVKKGLLTWNTNYFDLFPEQKKIASKVHHNLTLEQLLCFRTRLVQYTPNFSTPAENQFTGTKEEQRKAFADWYWRQEPVSKKKDPHASNLGYCAAAAMLEEVSGKSYEDLVHDLEKELHTQWAFGSPNAIDSLQPWGHFYNLTPEAPRENNKQNWLAAAGNISASLPNYSPFIQELLKAYHGKSALLSKEEMNYLFFALPRYSFGWYWNTNALNQKYVYNLGNPGSFLSMVYVFPESDKAILIFSNAQTESTEKGELALLEILLRKYGLAR